MPVVHIHTTQNVTLTYEAASVGDRIVAQLIDWLILGAWTLLMGLFISRVLDIGGETAGWLYLIFISLPLIFYSLTCEVLLNGQTLGKKARHLRVVRLDGTAPRFGDFLMRWLLSIVDVLISVGSVAVVTLAVNTRGQRLGDLAAGTTVVNLRPRASQLVDVVSAAQPTGYQPVFPQAGQLSDYDVNVLHQLVSRSLRQRNHVLLNETATRVKSLLGVRSDLGDEAFLRTVLRDHAHLVYEGEAMK